jgi:hypothetical protein
LDVFPVLEESEAPSSWPEESNPETVEVESVPAVEEREFPAAIQETKVPETAPEAPEAPFEDLKEKASGRALGGRLREHAVAAAKAAAAERRAQGGNGGDTQASTLDVEIVRTQRPRMRLNTTAKHVPRPASTVTRKDPVLKDVGSVGPRLRDAGAGPILKDVGAGPRSQPARSSTSPPTSTELAGPPKSFAKAVIKGKEDWWKKAAIPEVEAAEVVPEATEAPTEEEKTTLVSRLDSGIEDSWQSGEHDDGLARAKLAVFVPSAKEHVSESPPSVDKDSVKNGTDGPEVILASGHVEEGDQAQGPVATTVQAPKPVVTEELKAKIVKQVEVYFNDTNLPTENYLMKFVKKIVEGRVAK